MLRLGLRVVYGFGFRARVLGFGIEGQSRSKPDSSPSSRLEHMNQRQGRLGNRERRRNQSPEVLLTGIPNALNQLSTPRHSSEPLANAIATFQLTKPSTGAESFSVQVRFGLIQGPFLNHHDSPKWGGCIQQSVTDMP